MKKILSLLLVALMIVGMLPMMPITANAATGNYVKVTSAPADWSGEYLIVYETGKVAFNGQLTKLDNANNNVTVTINDGKIEATDAMKAASFTIEKDGTGYNIKSASGYYIGNNSNSNALSTNTSTKYVSTITLESDGSVKIAGSAGAVLRYNANSGNYRFRYFKSSTYTSQKAICLYKLEESSGGETVCKHTNTVAIGEPKPATCTEDGMTAGVKCADCGETITAQETIPALRHDFSNGESCANCGEKVTVVAYKITTAEEFVTGEYVVVANNGYALGQWVDDGPWVTAVQPTIVGTNVIDDANGIWNLTVDGSNVTMTDSNGVTVIYKSSTDNGISKTNGTWVWSVDADGNFTFADANPAKVKLASNTQSSNKFRAYKVSTINGNQAGYPCQFTLYKVGTPCTHTNIVAVGEAKDATCDVDGWTAGEKCADCGKVIKEQEPITALGHNFNEEDICTNCGAPKCSHANQNTVTTDATCAKPGSIVVTCADCGKSISEEEIPATGEHNYVSVVNPEATCTTDGLKTDTCSVCGGTKTETIPAIGHNYVDGFCANCSEPKPASLAGRYYIAAKRTAGGNIYYMTNALTSTSTKRYDAVDSGLTAVPESIEKPASNQVFVLVDDGNGIKIYAEGIDGDEKYLGWSSGNSGKLVSEAEASVVTVVKNEDGTVKISFVDGDGFRKLTLNNAAGNDYFAWYGTEQANIYIIPVVEGGSETPDPEPELPVDPPASCEHTNTTEVSVPATCYTAGSVTVTCDNCNEVVGTETLPAGHTFVEGVCSGCNLVEAPVAGTAYKFGMVQGKLNNKIYYINGAMDGYYMGTVEVDANGVSVYLEQTEGGYYFYTYVDGAKKYINTVVNGTYVNGAYEDTASTVYTYNAEKYTVVADVNGEAYWFGTRNDNTYTTMGPVKVSYNGFYGQFYAVSNKVTAAQGATQLQAEVENLYNGTELPATVMVGETVMNVVWSIEASDANAAKIEDGKLVLAPQAAAATYTLTATVKNGETDTATATWEGTVVPASAALENGTYVFWINDLAITNVFADTTKNYGDLTSTAGVALTDGKLTGHTNANIFTLTANGDGTYTIQANGGNYLYSDMSHASSRYFNLAAEKPASGADWTIVASDEGYYIYNVDRAGAIGLYASNNTFSLYTDAAKHSVLNVTAVAACAHSNKTSVEVPADCIHAGTRTETCDDCHMVLSETPIEPTGHSYVDGICSVCNGKDPYVFGIKYYIAAKRSEGNYMYMTSALGDGSTLRYQQKDSGLPIPPVNIEPAAAQNDCVFILMPNEDGTYYILAYGVEGDNYLGWTSGNSGILVSEAEALKVTLTEQADGTYIISFGEGDSKRNLALNTNADYKYFAWYTSEQCNDLSLIPVEETKEQVNQYGVVLNDGFLMKFNVSLTANAQIAITANGETVTYSAGQLSAVVNGTYDVYVELAAAQMADVVTVKFITDGVAGEPKTYTIKEYADYILDEANGYDELTKKLVTEMLAYGAAAQTYFEYNDKNLVSDGTGAGTEAPKADKEMTVTGNTDGIRFYGASLVFENKIALRFYFQVGENVTFAIEEKYTVSQKNGLYCVEIADILPQDLKNDYIVTVTDGPIVTYSPMNYLVRMNEKGGESLQALVVALYNYHLAAAAYAQPAAQ